MKTKELAPTLDKVVTDDKSTIKRLIDNDEVKSLRFYYDAELERYMYEVTLR